MLAVNVIAQILTNSLDEYIITDYNKKDPMRAIKTAGSYFEYYVFFTLR